MATEVVDKEVQNHFEKLEAQRAILSTCTDLFKTLTSHFATFDQSITSKCQTLDSKIQSLDFDYQKSIEDLQQRDDSITDRLSSLSSIVESRKQAAVAEFEKPAAGEDAPLADALKSVCRKKDPSGLLKLALARRRESVVMRAEMGNALAECVDPPRLVLDVVNEFVDLKAAAKSGLTDKRWACAMVVGGLFPPEDLKEKKDGAVPEFSRSMVERADVVLRQWRETAEKIAAAGCGSGGGGGENLSGMGPAEASIFLQIVIGFGLKDKFEDEYYKKLVMEFAARRDMPRLAIALFGDKIEDLIDELVKNGKQVEAVYFATEASLRKRFQPASLLDSFLQKSKNNVTDILKKGNHNYAAREEANTFEINSIKLIIKCVEDLKIESEYPLESLRKRLTLLEKAKADKKKGPTAGPKPSPNKRPYGSGPARSSNPPPPRPAKMTKFSSPYPSFGQRNPISPAQQSTVSRYPAPYNNYPSYDAERTTSSYGPSYVGSHIPPSAQITQPHYGIPGDNVGVGARLGGSYGGQLGYGSYEYSVAAPPTYRPPSYAQ